MTCTFPPLKQICLLKAHYFCLTGGWRKCIFQVSFIPSSPPQSFNTLSLPLIKKTLSDAGRRKHIMNSFTQQQF